MKRSKVVYPKPVTVKDGISDITLSGMLHGNAIVSTRVYNQIMRSLDEIPIQDRTKLSDHVFIESVYSNDLKFIAGKILIGKKGDPDYKMYHVRAESNK